MVKIGYTLSSEEFGPNDLVRFGERAEKSGFSFLMISDHYHPWVDAQGESPFVWNVIGALSKVTKRLNIGTGVTCPTIRIHPAIIAQAAATSQVMLEGRFILGVGSGENLNEHVVGFGWPPYEIRREMLNEAIEILRLLWRGGYQSYYGNYYTVDSARIYTLPKNKIPILYAAWGEKSATSAGKLGDGFISTVPDKKLVGTFRKNGGKGKPKYAQMSVCYDKSEEKAKKIMTRVWPLSGLPKPLNSELKIPSHFEKAAELVSLGDISKKVPMGPEPNKILESMREYSKAGYDHIYIHNIGPNQEEFLSFFTGKILPRVHSYLKRG